MSNFESWDTRNYERTDERKDEQKKRAIEVDAPPKNQGYKTIKFWMYYSKPRFIIDAFNLDPIYFTRFDFLGL